MNKATIVRLMAIAVMAVSTSIPQSAVANEFPEVDGGCTGEIESSTSADHCCSLNSCSFGRDAYATATSTRYINPGCIQNTHTGTNGCCWW